MARTFISMVLAVILPLLAVFGAVSASAQSPQRSCAYWMEERPTGNWQNEGSLTPAFRQASADCIADLERRNDRQRLVLLDAYLLTALNIINPKDLFNASRDWSEAARLKVNAVRVPFILSPFLPDADDISQWLEESRSLGDDRSRARFAYYTALYDDLTDAGTFDDAERDALLVESAEAGERGGVMRIGLFALNYQAVIAKQGGDYAKAVSLLTRIIDDSTAPRFELVHINALTTLGNLFQEIGDHDRAIALYDRAIGHTDRHPLTLGQIQLSRAIALKNARRLRDAETSVRAAIVQFADHVENESSEGAALPGLYSSRFELGRILYESGRAPKTESLQTARDAAEALYEADYFTESVHAEAFAWLASAYLEQGRTEEGGAMLAKARDALGFEVDPTNIAPDDQDRAFLLPYLRSTASYLRETGQFEQASLYAAAALELSEQRFEKEQIRAVGNADLIFALEEQEERALVLAQAAQLAESETKLANAARDRNMFLATLALTFLVAAAAVAYALYRAYLAQKATALAKDTFFSEMHHRVANNLQTLLSLFRMEARRNSPDAVNDHLPASDAAVRLRTMALLHDKLRARQSGTLVDTKAYLSELGELLEASLTREGIDLETNYDEALIEIDKAAPLGLLMSELLTNAYKHAFEGRDGRIMLSFQADGDLGVLTVADDGVGFDGKIRDGHLGLSLLEDLAEQIGARLERSSGHEGRGTSWQLTDVPLGVRNKSLFETARAASF